jgi:integrase
MKQKKFNGVYEYYRKRDPDKATVSYYISVREYPGAEAKKIKTNASTPEEASLLLAQYKARRNTAPKTSNQKLTLSQLAEKFFNQRNTINNAKDQRRFEMHAEPYLGGKLIVNISKQDILRLQKVLLQKQVKETNTKDPGMSNLSPRTINDVTDMVTSILLWAYNQELLPTPLPKIEKLRIDNERQRVFSQKELDAIFSSTEGSTHMFLLLAYHTAQRPQSILQLQKKHIINGSILIKSIKHQSSHLVPISSKLETELIPWVTDLKGEDYIVSKASKPMPYKTISKRVSDLFKILFNTGLDYKRDLKQWASMYTLRHTALTNIYANTSDIYAAQSIANHSSIKMTQRYAKHSEKLKRNAVEGL